MLKSETASISKGGFEKMISRRAFNWITYISLVVIFLLLIGMLTRVIPREYYIYALTVAILLFALRIVLRVQFFIQERRGRYGKEN